MRSVCKDIGWRRRPQDANNAGSAHKADSRRTDLRGHNYIYIYTYLFIYFCMYIKIYATPSDVFMPTGVCLQNFIRKGTAHIWPQPPIYVSVPFASPSLIRLLSVSYSFHCQSKHPIMLNISCFLPHAHVPVIINLHEHLIFIVYVANRLGSAKQTERLSFTA